MDGYKLNKKMIDIFEILRKQSLNIELRAIFFNFEYLMRIFDRKLRFASIVIVVKVGRID